MPIIEKEIVAGQCPKCKSFNLDFEGKFELDNNGGYFEFKCLDCGVYGKEHVELVYVSSSYEENN